MAYQVLDVAGVDLSKVYDDAKQFPVGMVVSGKDPTLGYGKFIFLKGVASTTIGSVVTYDLDGGVTALAIANCKGPAAVAMAAIVANKYGWYQIGGQAKAVANGAVADGASIYCTAAGGKIDDAVVAGDRLKGGAISAGTAAAQDDLVEISLPMSGAFFDDAEAA